MSTEKNSRKERERGIKKKKRNMRKTIGVYMIN